MVKLTQEWFGNDESQFRRGYTNEGRLPALQGTFGYFNGVNASHRKHPIEDFASTIANDPYRRCTAVRY